MDSKGHQLLRERARSIPPLLDEWLRAGHPVVLPHLGPSHFVVTGTGSSEAHGRYLTWLLNGFTPHTAEFRPLSAFLQTNHRSPSILVVFSQGISPNATYPLRQACNFNHLVLFTSATSEGLRHSGKKERAAFLDELTRAGASVIRFPLEDEYTTLLRLIGPMAGYLAAAGFVAGLDQNTLPPLAPNLIDLLQRAPTGLPEDLQKTSPGDLAGSQIIAADPVTLFAQNLAYKFLEGLFLPAPPVWDIFQYAHGPFQQNMTARHPVFLLTGSDPKEHDCEERILALNESAGGRTWIIRSSLPTPYRILEFEAIFNDLILGAIARWDIDQVNWPGKDLDGPVYELGSYEVEWVRQR
jgi:hypothetical protein